ncbi:MAG: MFS transporter [Gemmatimonas sp.]
MSTPHKAFAGLRHAGYRVYLIGSMLAMMADSIEHVISYWMVFQKFHSPALGGFAVISHWAPFLLFSMWSGALADRFDPRRVIQVAMAMFGAASLAWGLLFVFGVLEEWHAAIILVIHGFAGVLWNPAAQLLIHDIVGRDHLQSAVRLMSMARTLGMLAGPAVGGAILLAFGPAHGILINVLFYVPLALWLWRAPYGPRFRKEPPRARPISGLSDIVVTVQEIARNHVLASMTIVAGVSSFVVGNAYQAQMPEFAHDLGHGDAGMYYSMLLAANAAGALVGGALLETFGLLQARPRSAFVLVVLWCVCIGGFAVSNIYALSVALMFAAGVCNLAFSSMSQTLVQLNAPDHSRGRVIGIYNLSSNGMRAFSGVTVGIGGSIIGIHASLAASAAVLLLASLALLAIYGRERPKAATK